MVWGIEIKRCVARSLGCRRHEMIHILQPGLRLPGLEFKVGVS